jgi:hypothetical protein
VDPGDAGSGQSLGVAGSQASRKLLLSYNALDTHSVPTTTNVLRQGRMIKGGIGDDFRADEIIEVVASGGTRISVASKLPKRTCLPPAPALVLFAYAAERIAG